jgi:phosphocarrier protein
MHMRAANLFVEVAGRYAASVRVSRGEVQVNGKSIMGLMMLAAAHGTSIVVEVVGDDEVDAMCALEQLVDGGFGEEMAEEREDVT